MWSRLSCLLVIGLLLSSSALAQEIKLPNEIKVARPGAWFVVAPEIISGGSPKWRVDPGLEEQKLDVLFPPEIVGKAKGKIFAGDVGRYKIEVWNAQGDVPSDIVTCWVTIGSGPTPPPAPGPNPPPSPGPSPEPPPNPQPVGSLSILLLYESANQPSEIGNLINPLQQGAPADYLSSKNHRFFPLDDDSSDSDDKAIIDGWKVLLKDELNADGSLKLPLLLLLDPSTRKILLKKSYFNQPVPTADQVISVIKSYEQGYKAKW